MSSKETGGAAPHDTDNAGNENTVSMAEKLAKWRETRAKTGAKEQKEQKEALKPRALNAIHAGNNGASALAKDPFGPADAAKAKRSHSQTKTLVEKDVDARKPPPPPVKKSKVVAFNVRLAPPPPVSSSVQQAQEPPVPPQEPISHPISFNFSSSSSSPEIASQSGELDALKQREMMLALANKALQDQVSSEARARSLLERKVTDNKDEIAALKSNVARLQGTTDEMKQTIDALKQRAESLAVDVSSRESQIVRIMDASSKQTSALETKNEWFQRQLDSATNESESLREQVLEMTAKLQNAELLISRVIHIKKALQSGLKDMNLIMTESRAYVTSVLSARTIELVKDGEAQCDLPVKPKNSATQTYAANSIRVQTQTDPNSCNDSSVPISVISGTMGHLVDDLTSEIASHITCLTRQNESLTFRLIAASESSTSLTSASAGTIETLQHTLQSQQASIIDLKSRIAAAAEKERAQSADLSNMRTRLVTSESQRNAQADEIRDCYAVIDYFERTATAEEADTDLVDQLRVQTVHAETLVSELERVKVVAEARRLEMDAVKRELEEAYEVVDALQADAHAACEGSCEGGKKVEGKLKEAERRVEVLYQQLEEAHTRSLKPTGKDAMCQTICVFNEVYTDEEAKNAVHNMKLMNLEKSVLEFEQNQESLDAMTQKLSADEKKTNELETSIKQIRDNALAGIQTLLEKVKSRDDQIERLKERVAELGGST